MRYRKKSVVVEAVQWLNKKIVCPPGPTWFAEAEGRGDIRLSGDELTVETQHGPAQARPGDWIIRGIDGEVYPCRPDVFEATYEPA
jgi:hypothetical protein